MRIKRHTVLSVCEKKSALRKIYLRFDQFRQNSEQKRWLQKKNEMTFNGATLFVRSSFAIAKITVISTMHLFLFHTRVIEDMSSPRVCADLFLTQFHRLLHIVN